MRQLKTFMRNRRAEMLGCGDCQCRTLTAWKCMNENCGCGESGTSLPNKFKVRENSENLFLTSFFNEDVEQDNTISVEIEGEETADERVVVGDFLIIEDEDTRALWHGVWENLDAEAIEKLLGRYDEGNTGVGQFTPEAMAQFNAFVNNPTEEQAQILKDWLEDKASDEYDPPHYPIVIFSGSGGGVNSISTHIETININETRSATVEVVVDPYTASDVSFTAVSSDPNVLEVVNIIMYDQPTEWAVGHLNVVGVGQGQCNLVITSVANPNATVTIPVTVGQNIPVQTATPSSNSFTIYTDTLAEPVTLTDWYVDITPANATNVNDDVAFWNDENILGWGWISYIEEGRIHYMFNPVAYGTADYIFQCRQNTQTISVTVAQPGR